VIEALERETYPALLMELARAFVTEAASQLSSISAAVLAQDLAALKREALALKGGAGTFGAAQLVDYASARAQACLWNKLDRSIEVVRALPKVALVACKALADRYLDGVWGRDGRRATLDIGPGAAGGVFDWRARAAMIRAP